jgi:hypothetical protein
MIMAWYDFFNFKLGEHVGHAATTHPDYVSDRSSGHPSGRMPAAALPPSPRAHDPLLAATDNQRVAELADKISTLDKVMYYDQLAVTFLVAILQGTKKTVNSSDTTFNTTLDVLSFVLPATTTLVNGILKGVRDSAIQEKTALTPKI